MTRSEEHGRWAEGLSLDVQREAARVCTEGRKKGFADSQG